MISSNTFFISSSFGSSISSFLLILLIVSFSKSLIILPFLFNISFNLFRINPFLPTKIFVSSPFQGFNNFKSGIFVFIELFIFSASIFSEFDFESSPSSILYSLLSTLFCSPELISLSLLFFFSSNKFPSRLSSLFITFRFSSFCSCSISSSVFSSFNDK